MTKWLLNIITLSYSPRSDQWGKNLILSNKNQDANIPCIDILFSNDSDSRRIIINTANETIFNKMLRSIGREGILKLELDYMNKKHHQIVYDSVSGEEIDKLLNAINRVDFIGSTSLTEIKRIIGITYIVPSLKELTATYILCNKNFFKDTQLSAIPIELHDLIRDKPISADNLDDQDEGVMPEVIYSCRYI